MIKVYTGRNMAEVAKLCPVFAEIKDNIPVHPGDMVNRINEMIAGRDTFSTCSDVVIACIGYMIRTKKLSVPIHILSLDCDYEIAFDIKGDLIRYLPGEGFNSIVEASFYYRYD